jgi:hypothetical protein
MLPEGACTLAVERGECKRGRRRPIFGGGIKFDGIIFRGMKYSRGRKILRVSTLRARVVYMGAGGGWGPETRGPHGGVCRCIYRVTTTPPPRYLTDTAAKIPWFADTRYSATP